MSNWEYKVITSGKGGFATPALLAKFLNDLGQEEWDIIHFYTPPDNPLAFTGLARRSTQRDWTLEDAAAAAARVEADKLRAEFEAKFKSANSPAAASEEAGETFLADELPGTKDSFRRPVDTSRDHDPDAPDEEHEQDEWDKLAEEDELPTFFEALRPHLRKNHRGPGTSVGVDYLAKKWRLEESDIKGALVECGMSIPADENAKPVYVEFEGDLFWVNINRRGEIWINTREKPEPVFRIVPGKRLSDEEAPVDAAPAPRQEEKRDERRDERREERRPEPARPAPPAQNSGNDKPAQNPGGGGNAAKTFLDKLRSLMRRNRRGHGWSGSFAFLTKALRLDDATLLAQIEEQGLRLKTESEEKPFFFAEGDFLYWMDVNSRGEVWINARKGQGQRPDDGSDEGADDGGTNEAQSANDEFPAPATVTDGETSSLTPLPTRIPAKTLAAVRLLLEPKKRGDGFALRITELAEKLERTEDALLSALVASGLNVPDDAKAKPSFGEHDGEIFWVNRNAKGELWLNAKDSKAKRSRSRGKSSDKTDSDADSAAADDSSNES
ncbi:MAG: hypothetical protein Q8M02_01760 [Candidatus Didemnitutus sp.]|nr:hypothetical protein [Candidatus Didemnitutus sp.]